MKKNIRHYLALGLTVATLGISGVPTSITALANASNTSATASATQDTKDAAKRDQRKMDFSSLVTNGIIDQATADKMTTFMESKNAEREAEKEKVKAMSEADRKAYFESKKGIAKVDLFEEMVSKDILTQTQADSIKAIAPQRKEGDHDRVGHGKMDFSSLVTDGAIDQGTADKMTTFMESKNAEREAEKEKVKAMSETDRKAYFEVKKGTTKVDLFEEMVNEGILTQAQADAIKAAVPHHKDGGHK